MLIGRIRPASPFAPLRGRFHGAASLLVSSVLAGCAMLGAEITVDARNDSDEIMVVQVVDGNGAPHGPAHRLQPLEEREVELAVPGGSWTVTVNGARLVGSADAAGRTGRLPVTLILPAPDAPFPGPIWESPSDWPGTGP
jgi:hypothetical protein